MTAAGRAATVCIRYNTTKPNASFRTGRSKVIAAVSGRHSPPRQTLLELGMRKHVLLYGLLGGVLIAAGLSNKAIASRADVSENTVKTHSSRVFD